jgi:hypothetical protein
MASILYISEYTTVGAKYGMTIGSVRQPAIAEQTVSVTGVTAQSTQFNPATAIVRLSNDTGGPCTLKFGTNPTATTTSGIRMSAGQSEYFIVDNASSKVAAISVTA